MGNHIARTRQRLAAIAIAVACAAAACGADDRISATEGSAAQAPIETTADATDVDTGCMPVAAQAVAVDDRAVPFAQQRTIASESTIALRYERAGDNRDRDRLLQDLAPSFLGENLLLGFSVDTGQGIDEFQYYGPGDELDPEATYTTFMRDGGVLIESIASAYDNGLAVALLDGSEHPAAPKPAEDIAEVRVGEHRAALNLADPMDDLDTRPYLITWHTEGRDYVIHGAVDDPATIVTWARQIACNR